jgi:hypothetical protein
MSEGVQPPIDCGGSSALVVLCIDAPIQRTNGHGVNGPIARGKQQLEIHGRVVERMGRVVSSLSRRAQVLDRRGAGPHRSPLQQGLTCFQALPRTSILVACGGIRERRVAPGHADGPRPHARFDHLSRGSGMEEVRGDGTGAAQAAKRAS